MCECDLHLLKFIMCLCEIEGHDARNHISGLTVMP